MMSNRHQVTPTDHWYGVPSDRSAVGQRKLDELQHQLDHMQTGNRERGELMRKLEVLERKENEKKEIQDRVMGRNSRNSSPRLLKSEMERLYGNTSPLDRNITPDKDRRLVHNVIQQRTKEFSAKQQEAAIKAKYLDKERRRLQEARQIVEEQRRVLQNTMTPDGKPPFSYPLEQSPPILPEPAPVYEYKNGQVKVSQVYNTKSQEYHGGKNWKLRVKFVPMPIEDNSGMLERYNSAVLEGVDIEQQDETVQAFLNCTANQKQPAKHHRSAYYMPYSMPEHASYREQKILLGNRLDRKPELKGKWKKQSKKKDRKNNTFIESFKFGALHSDYRPYEKRLKDTHRVTSVDYTGVRQAETEESSTGYYSDRFRYFPPRNRKTSAPLDPCVKAGTKVKFRAVPSYPDPLLQRYRTLGGNL